MTPSRPLRSAGNAAAAGASVGKVRGLGVIETVIGRIATDLEVVELARLDSPEFAGGDEGAAAHHVQLEPRPRVLRIVPAPPGIRRRRRPLRRFDLSLLAGMAPPIMAHVGSGRAIVRPISRGTV